MMTRVCRNAMRHSDLKTGVVFHSEIITSLNNTCVSKSQRKTRPIAEYPTGPFLFVTNVRNGRQVGLRSAVCPNLWWVSTWDQQPIADAEDHDIQLSAHRSLTANMSSFPPFCTMVKEEKV
jgi:hypothetical protein